MADFYTSAFLRRLESRKGRPWCGVLKYQEPNPEYMEDGREPSQRRRSMGRRANPDYVEDRRSPAQRRPFVQRQVTKVFDPKAVRTKTQANAALVAWRAQMEAEHVTPDASLTVAGYVERYVAARERLGTVSPTTVRDYRGTSRYLRQGGRKAIAGVTLRDLTPAQVEDWEAALLESGLSGTTALKAHRLVKQVCKYAFEIGDIPVTPVRGFKAPRNTTGKPNALDAKGRRQAMLGLSAMGSDPVAIAAQLALYTGMRRGEVCALTWANVDLDGTWWEDANEPGPKVRVSQSFGESQGGAYLKQPKTASGRRVIPVTGGLLDVLRRRRVEMWREWSAAMQRIGIVPTERAFRELYVIGGTDGGYCSPNTLTHAWTALARRLDLRGTEGRRVTFHDLRHSYATSAVTRGVDVSSVAANIGHAQVSTTLNMYTSRDSAAQREASRVVADDLDSARMGVVVPFAPRTGTEG